MDNVESAVRSLADALRAEMAAATNTQPTADRLLSIPEAMGALGIGRSALYGEIGAGRLRTIRVGRRRLIPASAIHDYIGSAAA